MPLQALPRTSLSARAYGALLQAIVRGDLAPGERLRDVEIAEQLGVSRTPVREALRRLEDEGLVVTAPGASTRVAAVDADSAAQAFPLVAALHGLAARLGVGALDERDLATMEQAHAEAVRALQAGDVVGAIEADDRFHRVVIDAAGNHELESALRRVMPKVRRLDVLHFSCADATRDHDAFLDACRRRAPADAAAIAEESFLRLGRQMAAVLEPAAAVTGGAVPADDHGARS